MPEIIQLDENGNVVKKPKATLVTLNPEGIPTAPFKPAQHPELQASIKPAETGIGHTIRNLRIGNKSVTDLLDPLLITLGEGAGTLAGHPWLGAAGGSLASQGIEALSPSTFGQNRVKSVLDDTDWTLLDNPIVKAIVDATISRGVTRGTPIVSTGLEAAAQVPANIVRRIAGKPTVHPIQEALFDWFTKPSKILTSPATREALKTAPANFEYSVGDATGSDLVKRIEATFGREAKEKIVQQAHSLSADEMRSFYDYDTGLNVKMVGDAARGFYENLSKNVRNAYDDLKGLVRTVKTPPLYTPRRGFGFGPASVGSQTIEGPVTLTESGPFAKEVSESVKKAIGYAEGGNAPLAENPLNRIISNLDSIANPKQYFKDPELKKPLGYNLSSYERVKALRDAIDDTLSSKEFEPFKSRLEGALLGLRSRLGKDLEASADNLWPAEVKAAMQKANALYKEKLSKFDNDLARKLLRSGRDPDLAYSDVARTALSSPERAQQWINATGDRKVLGELYTSDIVKNSMVETPTGWIFDGGKALDVLNSTKDIGRTALDSARRANLEFFFRRVAAIDPQITQSMATAVQIRGASTGLKVVGDLGTSMLTGSVGPSLGTGATILGFIFRTKDFTKNVLLNPKYSRLAAEGVKARPTAYFTKAMLGAMKGTQIWVETPEGQFPATVDENGRVKME